MSKSIVYHGSNQSVKFPEIRKSKYTKDFGPGFYCTVLKEQSQRWALRNQTAVVNAYAMLLDSRLEILEFSSMTEEWLDFIVACRNGTPHSYDVVIGPMADDQIYNFITDFVEGDISREQFWAMAKFRYPTHQIVFCTETALRCLSFVSSEELTQYET